MCFYIFHTISSNAVPTQPYIDPNPSGPFSLKIKEEIQKYQTQSQEHLNNLKLATGFEYAFLVDFELMHKHLPASVFKKRMAEIVLDKYLGALVSNIVSFVQESEANKKTFILKTFKKQIIFNPFVIGVKKKPVEIKFDNGCIYIHSL